VQRLKLKEMWGYDFMIVGVCYRSQEADENELSQLFEY